MQLCKTAVLRKIGAIAERYMDIQYKVPNSYMMVKSRLIPLLNDFTKYEITSPNLNLLTRIFHVLVRKK